MAYATYSNPHLANALGEWFKRHIEALKLRRERARVYRDIYDELAAMSDRDLADVGLSRPMIQDIAREAAGGI